MAWEGFFLNIDTMLLGLFAMKVKVSLLQRRKGEVTVQRECKQEDGARGRKQTGVWKHINEYLSSLANIVAAIVALPRLAQTCVLFYRAVGASERLWQRLRHQLLFGTSAKQLLY